MLNPSSADYERDDPTIRRCMGLARREGHGGIDVVNLFAFRTARPADLKRAVDPEGPQNRAVLAEAADAACRSGLPALCAWGAHGAWLGRGQAVTALLRSRGLALLCLGRTASGEPLHPLYVPAGRLLVDF